MLVDGRHITADTAIEADAVIVGTGAGGAPMAYHLARAGLRVIVLEEGGKFMPGDFNRNAFDMTEKMYRGAGSTVTLGVPGVALPIGKTYGGTTTINSGTCFRIPDFIWAKWHKEGLTATAADLAPYYEDAERIIHVEPVPWEMMGEGNRLFAEGAKALGLRGGPLSRNAKGCKGSGLCAFGCPTGGKQSMGLTYLPAAEEAGATVYTYTRAKKIRLANGRASGIEAVLLNGQRDRPTTLRIDAPIVVLAAGTVYTPLLLQQNRLANSSGEVGKNFRLHPAAKVIGFFEHDIYGWTGVPQAYYVDEFIEEGITMEGFFVPPAMLAFALPAFGHRLKQYMANYNKMAGFGVMVSDTSSGRVRPGLFGAPLMTYNVNKADTASFLKGIAIAAQVYFAAGAKSVLTPIFGHEELKNADEAKKLLDAPIRAADLELIGFNPMGTCRMGGNPNKDVVAEDGQTHDVPGLYVADGSIFRSSLGVNPQLSIMAFSSRIADGIIKARQGSARRWAASPL